MQLVFETLRDDAPILEVRTGAIRADSSPAKQDHCAPVVRTAGAWSALDGGFGLYLGPDDLELRQPWAWDSLSLEGTRLPDEDRIDGLVAQASIPLLDLIAAAELPSMSCEGVAALGLDCGPCLALQGDCIFVDLKAQSSMAGDFVLEPVSREDIALNPGCQP